MKFISCMRPVCQEWEILSNEQKPTEKVKENEETEEYLPKLGRNPEADFNKTDISDLPNR